jgi:succinoglycan biosynthesis transport protein ExoP
MSGAIRHNPVIVNPAPDLGWDAVATPWAPSRMGSLSIAAIVKSLWRRKIWFVLISVILLLPAGYVIMQLPPIFKADALLVLRLREPHFEDIQPGWERNSLSAEANMNLIRSEIQILTSNELAERVVLDLHLDEASGEPKPPSIVHIATDYVRKSLGLEAPVVATSKEQRLEDAVKAYQTHFTAFNDGKSFVIAIAFTADSPELAKKILADHLRFYLADQITEKEVALDGVHNWLEVELAKLATKVQESEQQLQRFRGVHNLLRSGGETIDGHQLDDLVSQLSRARADLLLKQSRLQDIQGVNRGNADAAMLASPVIQKGREQEAALTSQLAEMSRKYGPNFPSVRSTAASLEATRASIDNELGRMAKTAQADVNVATSNVQSLQKAVDELGQAAGTSELTDLSKAQLQRETDADRQLYGELLRRAKQIDIQRQIQQEPDAHVASTPSVSFIPSSPHRSMLFLISACICAGLGGLASLFIDRRHWESRSLLEIEAICRIPGFTSVPQVKLLRNKKLPFPARMDPRSVCALSLQTLRNSLSFHAGGRPPQAVAFTSALPGEGKTFLSVSYAQSLAMAGQRVLLIDADMRQSGLTQLFSVNPAVGIQSALLGTTGLADCVRRVAGLNFDILLSEKRLENPQDLLNSPAFAHLLHQARAAYDFIVFDTPPIAAVDDALPVAKIADATVLVIRWSRTSHDVVRAAVRRLHLGGVDIMGAVLNAVDMTEYQSSSQDLEAYRPLRSTYIVHQR